MSLKDMIKIMVVDDMSVSRGLLEAALDHIGIRTVDYENDGATAFAKIARSPVHLVISDYNMPNMNGLELLQALRGSATTQNIGFILVTGSEEASVVVQGQALGMNNFLKKPFTPDNLRTCIEAVVGRL